MDGKLKKKEKLSRYKIILFLIAIASLSIATIVVIDKIDVEFKCQIENETKQFIGHTTRMDIILGQNKVYSPSYKIDETDEITEMKWIYAILPEDCELNYIN